MNRIMPLQVVLLLNILLCGDLYADLDELFKHIESPDPKSGLIVEVAAKKPLVLMGDPVTVYVRFRNVTGSVIAVVLGGGQLSTARSNLFVRYADIARAGFKLGSTGRLLLVPANGSTYVALTNYFFKEGSTRFNVQYECAPGNRELPNADINVWRGRTNSNEVEIVVRKKEGATDVDKDAIEKRAMQCIDLLASRQPIDAEEYLIMAAPDTVVPIIANLKHPNEHVRVGLLSTLGRIVRRGKVGTTAQSITLINELVSGLENEESNKVRAYYALTLAKLYHVSPARIVGVLSGVINNSDNEELRASATVALLNASKADGFREAFRKNRMDDRRGFYGVDGWDRVYQSMTYVAGFSDQACSVDQLKKWWKDNKMKLEAEAKQIQEKAALN